MIFEIKSRVNRIRFEDETSSNNVPFDCNVLKKNDRFEIDDEEDISIKLD